MQAYYWLILFAVLLAIEAFTMGLTTIWFAGGALIAFVAALLGANIIIQQILWLVVSVILLVLQKTGTYQRRSSDWTGSYGL